MSVIIRTNVEIEYLESEKLEQRKLELTKQLNVSLSNRDYIKYLILQDIKKIK